ncbi:sialate O-acetylesterase [Oleiharenicola lentus]|uniref:sialate O-acetylesterase n=1 Tax=Oleiharenicola lentus TaxID=2508720 RepID=UPI003F661EEE
MPLILLRALAPFALLLAITSDAFAAVTCAPVFSDHLVLQRETPVPIWGQAKPGERITVEFGHQRKATLANEAGSWRVSLDAMPANRTPQILTVRGENVLTFTDVLVGEVWFCSGQSNMEKPFGPRKGQKPTDNSEPEVAAANHPQLRIFQMPQSGKPKGNASVMTWLACSPETLAKSGFSAAAYYFGRELLTTLDMPVGLIHASFGGTRIEAWMPPGAFASSPELTGLEKNKYQAWVPGVQATELYQSMVAPLVPFALRGFLWYQGEANCMDADITLYAAKQRALIASWRSAWQLPPAPFYFALLAPFDYSRWDSFPKKLTPEALPAFWESQIATLDVKNTGLIVTTDLVANVHDIHPTNKRDVGLRFARLALAETYQAKNVQAHSPAFKKLKTAADGKLRVQFEHAQGLRSRDQAALTHFSIAGKDGIFHPAAAIIVKNEVVVSSPLVRSPIDVRFAWQETATPNLVNAAGLPAIPFRTDRNAVVLERAPAAK